MFTFVLDSTAREGRTEERGRKGYYGKCGTWLRLRHFPFSSKYLPHRYCQEGLVSRIALGMPLAVPASPPGAVRAAETQRGWAAVPAQLCRALGPSTATPACRSSPQATASQGSGCAAGARRRLLPLSAPQGAHGREARSGRYQHGPKEIILALTLCKP